MEAFADSLARYEQLLMRFARDGQNRQLASTVSRERQALLHLVDALLRREFDRGVDMAGR